MASLSIDDLVLLRELQTARSVRSLGRALHADAGNTSRRLKTLEEHLGHPLVARTPQGITPTDRALELAERAARVLEDVDRIVKSGDAPRQERIIGGPGYLIRAIAARAGDIIATSREQHLTFLELSPSEMRELADRQLASVLLSMADVTLPSVYVKQPVTRLDWAFFTSPDAAARVEARPDKAELVLARYFDGQRLRDVRRLPPDSALDMLAHRYSCQTAQAAAALASTGACVCYVPRVVAREQVAIGQLVEVKLAETETDSDALYCFFHADRTTPRFVGAFMHTLARVLESEPMAS
jgi:DNA-binding transcriptional LysR family regulator